MKKIAAILILTHLFAFPASAEEFRFSPRPNKAGLVQWRTWGPAALAEAKEADKPILLSLSAVWCHWCHVMDETSYSDDGVIALLNELFIPIRVDADLRPDIDNRYNQGGWPSTVFLTPAGEVIDGGNYLPPDELRSRLERISGLYRTDRASLAKRIEERRTRSSVYVEAGNADQAAVDGIVDALKAAFDEEHGGFGRGQKFPSPDALDFLMAVYAKGRDEAVGRMVTVTLDRMARGGLYDPVEGGFFRYATKPDWSEPHYEKMLETNAGLIGVYSRASLLFKSEPYRAVVRKTVAYVRKGLSDPRTGALFGSQDADEDYYKTNKRKGPQPLVDRRTYADSASLLISGLTAAWAGTGEREYLALAGKAADFLSREMYRPGAGIAHAYQDGKALLPGQLNDNALFGTALLDLYNATGDPRYLDRAGRIGQTLTARFYDSGAQRFRTSLAPTGTAGGPAGSLGEMNADLANFRAIRFLARYSAVFPDKDRSAIIAAAAGAFAGSFRRYPPVAPSYGLALQWMLGEPVEVRIVANDGRAREYLAAAARVYAPQKTVRVLSLSDDREEIKSYGYKAREAAYLCAGKRCSRPVKDPAMLTSALQRFLEESFEPGEQAP